MQHADDAAIDAAIAAAAALTPRAVRAVVLGCTHYELVGERIRAAVQRSGGPAVTLLGSAEAVAAQALRRIGAVADPAADPSGGLTVILSGQRAALPASALAYAEGVALGATASA
ncbi:glutamate racemase [Streptomyces sp. SPB162]|nr:glutamate racemase [Streptomyces sp. SPB162]